MIRKTEYALFTLLKVLGSVKLWRRGKRRIDVEWAAFGCLAAGNDEESDNS